MNSYTTKEEANEFLTQSDLHPTSEQVRQAALLLDNNINWVGGVGDISLKQLCTEIMVAIWTERRKLNSLNTSL